MSRGDVGADYLLALAGAPEGVGTVLAEVLVALDARGYAPAVRAAGRWRWSRNGLRATRPALARGQAPGEVYSLPGTLGATPVAWYGRADELELHGRYGQGYATADEAAAAVDAALTGASTLASTERWALAPGGLPPRPQG